MLYDIIDAEEVCCDRKPVLGKSLLMAAAGREKASATLRDRPQERSNKLICIDSSEKMVYDEIDPEELAPWRSPLAGALHRNSSLPQSRYLQLATVNLEGCPANRTVVFRGFLEGTNRLKIISDRRSQKIEQIEQNPLAEACWYFTKTREQFRLAGKITVVKAEDFDTKLKQIRASVWQEISDAARVQFAWPSPGEKRAEAAAFELASPDKIEPSFNFCLLLLEPIKVEHLELRGDPQNRWLYQRDGSGLWSTLAINP